MSGRGMIEGAARRVVHGWEGVATGVDHTRAYRAQRADAMVSLRDAVRNAGARLADGQRRACDAYAREVLGSRWHAPWLYVYTAMRGTFLEGWIPASYMGRWVAPAMSSNLRSLSGTKTLTRRLLPEAPLPDLGYVLNGRLYDQDLALVEARSFLKGLAERHPTVVVKQDGGYRGFQVRQVPVGMIDPDSLGRWGNAVIQQRVRQHPELEAVVPGSVATYRIVTARTPDGSVSVRCGNVKFGRAGDTVIRAGSKYMVAVVADDGTLSDIGHTDDWTPSPVHPDTGRAVPSGRLPAYREAARLCRSLHEQFPHFGLVGWDVTADSEERVVVLEWNAGHIGVSYSESMIGPSFTGLGWESLHRRPRTDP